MPAADLLIARFGEILDDYHRVLRASDSPLVSTPKRWQQCRRQAEAILTECAEALNGRLVRQPDLHRHTREVAVNRALQHVPIAESIRAGMLLWRVTIPRLARIASSDAVAEDAVLATLDALYQSISIRLCIGALTYEDAGLARMVLTTEEQEPQVVLAGAEQYAASHPALTAREQQVLAGVALAKSNRVIAKELKISEATVKRHMGNIFGKLGAISRVDAINKAGLRRPSS